MITLTVSFNPNESNAEILAQVVRLLAGIEANYHPSNANEAGMVVEEVKAKKPRKKRVFTEEQKAEFRARMIAGRKAKEAESKAAEEESDNLKKVNGSTKLSMPESKAPMPRTGKKLEAKPAAE